MTKQELLKRYHSVLDLSNRLNIALQSLGAAASEFCGTEVVAEICNGEEIEFRRVNEEGIADAFNIISIEKILDKQAQ